MRTPGKSKKLLPKVRRRKTAVSLPEAIYPDLENELEVEIFRLFPPKASPPKKFFAREVPWGESEELLSERLLMGKRWTEVSAVALEEAIQNSGLIFISREAFAYYLPAMMVHALRAERSSFLIEPFDYQLDVRKNVETVRGVAHALSREQYNLVRRVIKRLKGRFDDRFHKFKWLTWEDARELPSNQA